MLGLHAESDWTCRSYTFMLLENIIFSGILSDLGLTASWRCPAWFLLCLLSYHYPLFPPKKKSDAEKAELARAELDAFIASHGKVPSQHSDLPGSKSLYQKLQKLKLLHLLKHDWRRGVCDDTLKFYDLHGRIPRRQNMTTDEQRAEDALAQRWDRLQAQKASLPNELLNEYHQLFTAAEMEVDDGHLAVCVAVSEFFDTTRRLPKRQVGDSDEKRAEDALARRWDRLMAEKASASEELLSSYSAIFGAAEMEVDDAPRAVCIAVNVFSRMRSKGSRFTLGVWGLRVCSLDVAFASATVRNRPQPFARSPYAEVVIFGGFRRVVASFRVAGVALRDIQTCSGTCRKSFCVAGAILSRRFHKMCCSFRGRRSTLDVSIVIFRGRRSTLDVSCCVFFVNRIGRAASSGDKVQIPWQAWHFVRCAENWRKPRTKHRFWCCQFSGSKENS